MDTKTFNKHDLKNIKKNGIIELIESKDNTTNFKQINIKKKVITFYDGITEFYGIARLCEGDKFDITKGCALAMAYAYYKGSNKFRLFATRSYLKDIIPHKSDEDLMIKVALMRAYNLFGNKEVYEYFIEEKIIKQQLHLDLSITEFNKLVNSNSTEKDSVNNKNKKDLSKDLFNVED